MPKLIIILIHQNPSKDHLMCIEQNKVNMSPCKNRDQNSDEDTKHDKVHFLKETLPAEK